MVLQVIDLLAIICFCLLAIGVTLRHVLFDPGLVTLNHIVGALCVYLLLGVLWASLFSLVEVVEPAAFYYGGPEAAPTIGQFLY